MSEDRLFIDVVEAEAVPVGTSVGLEIEGQRVALFNHEGQYFVTQNSCPHMGASLAGGPMLKAGGVRCMLHGWVLRFKDCEDDDGLRRFPVKVEDGRVLVCPKPLPSDQAPVVGE